VHAKSMVTLEFDKVVNRLSGLAATPGGKFRCERLEPVSNIEEVIRRQNETTAVNVLVEAFGMPPLYGVHDIRRYIKRSLTGATLSAMALLHIASFLRCVERLTTYVKSPETVPDIDENKVYIRIKRLIVLKDLEQSISNAIISENEIADHASPLLANIRESIRRTQNSIKRRLEELLQSRSSALQEQLITMRNGRYVLPVKASHKGSVPGIVHDASATGQTVFIEPTAVVEANNRIRELEIEEREEIERILAELSAAVASEKNNLYGNYEEVGWIDFINAKGHLSRQMKATEPNFNDQGIIHLYGARHPLIDPQEVVPIEFYIGDEFKTLVITGPNTGGKTVSLKTCGLLSLMGMAGLHIPAELGSKLSVFKNVMADIGDEQSIEQSLSTFSSHMRNIVSITDAASPDILVLTDELGSGTDPSEGAALAIAVLDFLRSRGVTTVATTHYRELKVYALEEPEVENACCEFDVETLEPTYRLLIGVPGVSNAFVISQKLGLNRSIIRYARERLSDEGRHFESVIKQIEEDRIRAADLRHELEMEKISIEKTREKLDRRAEKIRERETNVINEVREEARRKLQKQLDATDHLLTELRQAGVREDAEALRHELKRELNTIEGEIGRETLSSDNGIKSASTIKVGNTYYCKTLKTNGKVDEGPDNQGRYLFRAGALKLWVGPDDLAPVQGNGTKSQHSGAYISKANTFRNEINLIGQTAEEALVNLDRFLDQAVLANVESVRIVHGKGAGILRNAVDKALQGDRRVISHRLGRFGEGDMGVTIATLR
jgi:DNA mismatch repair protein MutS2